MKPSPTNQPNQFSMQASQCHFQECQFQKIPIIILKLIPLILADPFSGLHLLPHRVTVNRHSLHTGSGRYAPIQYSQCYVCFYPFRLNSSGSPHARPKLSNLIPAPKSNPSPPLLSKPNHVTIDSLLTRSLIFNKLDLRRGFQSSFL